MKAILTFVLALALACLSGHGADLPTFKVGAKDIANIVFDVTPNEPSIFSITLSKEKLEAYRVFTTANLNEEISLMIMGIEIYRPFISKPVDENPLTFRTSDTEMYIAILSALAKETAIR